MKHPLAAVTLLAGALCPLLLRGRAASAAPADPPAPSDVTFARDIAPILFTQCVTCHRPGEVAPFPLTSYKDAKKRARQIADVTESRFMPPWMAEKGHGDFVGERRLSDDQIKLIRAWADAGAPEGDPSEFPPLPTFPDGWTLGQPDLVLKMSESYELKAEGRDVFRVFVVPTGLTEDKYVRAVEFRPSNRKVVHHALFFLDNSGTARKLDAQDPGPGYSRMGGPGFLPTGGLGGWAPGFTPFNLPRGVGRPVRKGADLVIQVHFHPSGKVETEQSTIGLFFTKEPPEKILIPFPRAARRKINIPPGEKNFEVNDTFTVPADTTLIGITPHAHLLCKEIKVQVTPPGQEKKQSLIWITNWDWDWQDEYQYKEPVQIPAGSKVEMYYRYDNSKGNPKNPSNPPKRVTWGEQTTDEMAIIFFQVLVDRGQGLAGLLGGRHGGAARGEGGGAAPRGQGGAVQQMLIRRFDRNGNGKLDPPEQEEARRTLRRIGEGGADAPAPDGND